MSRRNRRSEKPLNPEIILELPPAARRCVEDLLELGIFGTTPSMVVDGLLLSSLQSLAQDGWLDIDGFPAGDGD